MERDEKERKIMGIGVRRKGRKRWEGMPHIYTCTHIKTYIHMLCYMCPKLRSSTWGSQSHNGKCLLATVLFHISSNHPHPIHFDIKGYLCIGFIIKDVIIIHNGV